MRKALFYLLTGSLSFFLGQAAFAYDSNLPYPGDNSAEGMHTALNLANMKREVEEARCNECWFFGVGFGPAWVKPKNSLTTIPNQTPFPPPGNVDQYAGNNDAVSSPVFSAVGGYRWVTSRTWPYSYSVGLRYRYFFTSDVDGDVILESRNPINNNYSFSAASTMQVLTLFAKTELVRFGDFAPYISVGLGGSMNNFNSYSEVPKAGVTSRVSPGFGKKSTIDVEYEAGFGLDYYVRRLVLLSAEYDYLNLGSLASGNGSAAWSATHLNFGDVTAHTLLFSATYIFRE